MLCALTTKRNEQANRCSKYIEGKKEGEREREEIGKVVDRVELENHMQFLSLS